MVRAMADWEGRAGQRSASQTSNASSADRSAPPSVGKRTLTSELDPISALPSAARDATADSANRADGAGAPPSGRSSASAVPASGAPPRPGIGTDEPPATGQIPGRTVPRLDLRDAQPENVTRWAPRTSASATGVGDAFGVPASSGSQSTAPRAWPRSTETSAAGAAASNVTPAPQLAGTIAPVTRDHDMAARSAAPLQTAEHGSLGTRPDARSVAPHAAATRHPDAASDINAAVAAGSTTLGEAFAAKRQALQAALGAQTTAITSAAMQAHASTLGALSEREQRARTMFEGARANVRTAQATQLALARADMTAALDQLHGRSGGVVAQIPEAAQAEATRMQTAANNAARNVATSGAALRADITARPIGDLHAQVPDIEPDEARGVEAAIGQAKASASSAVLDADPDASDKLRTTARENGAAFISSATSVVEQVSAKLPQAEQSIRSGGDAVAALIDHMAGTQLAAIDVAEHQALAPLVEAKTQAGNLIAAGRVAAAGLNAKIGAHIAGLSTQEAEAQGQLQAAGAHASSQITGHQEVPASRASAFGTQTRASIQQGYAASDRRA
jgi:hypothetical protein